MSKKSSRIPSPPLVCVPLVFDLPEAVSVSLAGSFNDWDPFNLPLERTEGGRWDLVLQLPVGRYEFRLVIDGVWSDVPSASDTVENPFGSRNAVLSVAPAC